MGAEGTAAEVRTEAVSLQSPKPAELPACTWQLYSVKGWRPAAAADSHDLHLSKCVLVYTVCWIEGPRGFSQHLQGGLSSN